jgi:hypothetical protein
MLLIVGLIPLYIYIVAQDPPDKPLALLITTRRATTPRKPLGRNLKDQDEYEKRGRMSEFAISVGSVKGK